VHPATAAHHPGALQQATVVPALIVHEIAIVEADAPSLLRQRTGRRAVYRILHAGDEIKPEV
jgi:hypothetical protein